MDFYNDWIPAYAGMTEQRRDSNEWISISQEQCFQDVYVGVSVIPGLTRDPGNNNESSCWIPAYARMTGTAGMKEQGKS
jgi:hypothetical protein